MSELISRWPNLFPLKKHVGFGVDRAGYKSWLHYLAMTKGTKLCEPQFSHLNNGDKSICLSRIAVRIKWEIYVTC